MAGVEERSSRSGDASALCEGPDAPPARKAAGVAGPSRQDGSDERPRPLGYRSPGYGFEATSPNISGCSGTPSGTVKRRPGSSRIFLNGRNPLA